MKNGGRRRRVKEMAVWEGLNSMLLAFTMEEQGHKVKKIWEHLEAGEDKEILFSPHRGSRKNAYTLIFSSGRSISEFWPSNL